MKHKLTLLVIVLLASSYVFAAPGDLDLTLGGTGYLQTLPNNMPFDVPVNLLAVQPDGKIVTAALTYTPGLVLHVMRFNASGSPDLSFGTNGVSQSPNLVYSWSQVSNLALQADGKILIAGKTTLQNPARENCAVERLNADGSIDNSFNGNGLVEQYYSQGCVGTNVVQEPDGKIVLGGYYSVVVSTPVPNTLIGTWVALRYNADGSKDPSFGQDGAATITSPFGKFDHSRTVMVQPDGKVVIAGDAFTYFSAQVGIGLVRFNENGTLDTSYGAAGKAVAFRSPEFKATYGAAMQPDGKIVVIGCGSKLFMVARFNTDGALDTGFGDNGFTNSPWTASSGPQNFTSSVVIAPDGKIYVGGTTGANGERDLAVVRYNSDGSIDRAPAFPGRWWKTESVLSPFWGNAGIAVADIDSAIARQHSMTIDPAGRVLISGNVSNTNTRIARFEGDASPYAAISGTVRTAGGLPIRNAYVTISGGELAEPVTMLTNNLGIYFFSGLPVTESYTVTATAKRFRFANGERAVTLNADTENFDFAANQ
jgi:uncharacterized delta-60 repeat protein